MLIDVGVMVLLVDAGVLIDVGVMAGCSVLSCWSAGGFACWRAVAAVAEVLACRLLRVKLSNIVCCSN